MTSLVRLAATLLAFLALPAAAATATFTARESVNYFYYFGGYAISSDVGEAGDPAPLPGGVWEGSLLTGFARPDLSIQGSDHHAIAYLSATGFLDETWDQAQNFDVTAAGADTLVHIQGYATISQTSEVCGLAIGCAQATEVHRSTNTLVLEFSLDRGVAYELQGVTSGGAFVDLLRWDVPAQRWFSVIGSGGLTTIDRSFSLAGNLTAGLYRLESSPDTFSGGTVDVVNSWEAMLTLQGTRLANPVPEPHAGWLAALGLMFIRRLHRHGRE